MKAKEIKWRKAVATPIVLVSGPDDYIANRVVREVRAQLVAKLGNIEVEHVLASEYTAGMLNNLAAPSLFAEPKLIVIDEVEKCSDDLITDGIAYCAKPEPDTHVIFLHNASTVRGKKLLDAIKDTATASVIVLEKAKDKDFETFVADEFAAAGRQIHPKAVVALAGAFTGSFAEVAGACEQLMADSTETITEELVDQYYGGRLEVKVFKIVEAALAGRKVQALELLRHALGSGQDKVLLVGGIAGMMRKMASLMGPATVAPNPSFTDWQIRNAKRDLGGWTDESMTRVITAVAEADSAAKGASRDPEFAIEQLILLIANKGRVS